jgi:hypothetical protein
MSFFRNVAEGTGKARGLGRSVFALLALAGSVGPGCAAHRPPPGAPNAGPTVSTSGVSAPEARQVQAPAGLILVGRVRGYREVLGLTGTPSVVALLEKKLADEEPILVDIDLTKPVEFAVVYDRNFHRKPSAPPPAAEPETKADDESAEGEEDSEVEPEPAPSEPEENHVLVGFSVPLKRFAPETYPAHGYSLAFGNAYAHDSCLIAPSLGSAPARVICADNIDAAEALHDYMARGLPLETLSSSPIFAEFRPGPLKEFWEPRRVELNAQLKMLSAMGGPTARAAEEVAVSLLQELDAWVASLEHVRFEAGPNARGEFQASARLGVKSPEPWLIQSYLEAASAVRGAPPEFLGLPKDIRSAAYAYGMPDARAGLLQSALVQLAKSALNEYGPPSQRFGSKLKPAESQAMDHVVSELMRMLDSPCFRASRSVWANGAGGPMPEKKPFAADAVLRSALGYYLVATPTASHCDVLLDSVLNTVEGLHKVMPAKARREFPFTVSLGKTTKLPGLGNATTHRITLSKEALRELFAESKKKLDAKETPNKEQWAAPQSALTLTLFVLPNANGAGSDWFAFGLDEKPMKVALTQLFHPAPGNTLANVPALAPFLASNPLSLSYGTFLWQSQLIQSVLGVESKTLSTLSGVFDALSFTTTSHVVRHGASSEARIDYTVSPEGLNGVRSMLTWDIARWQQLGKLIDEESKKKP